MTELELHAFVDSELTGEERLRVLEAAAACAETRVQIEQLQCLKDLLRISYRDTPPETADSDIGDRFLNQRKQRLG